MYSLFSSISKKVLCLLPLLTLFISDGLAGNPGNVNEPKLSGETNRPQLSMFASGENVELTFKASGLDPKASKLSLSLNFVDAFEKNIKTVELPVVPDSAGNWIGMVQGPSDKLGLYRVRAKLSNGVTISQTCSRPPGYITYGVTFAPSSRKRYPEDQTFFGMQGGTIAGIDSYPWLGVRWALAPSRWNATEPKYPGQFADNLVKNNEATRKTLRNRDTEDNQWPLYLIFNICGGNQCLPDQWKNPPYVTAGSVRGWGKLTPEGEKYFENYCRLFVKTIAEEYPELEKRYYEVLWEPDLAFNGDAEDMVKFFRIAYPAIHAADPHAVVCGPNFSYLGQGALRRTKELFDKGLGRYIDIYTIHPYIEEAPEPHNLVGLIRELKQIVREGAGRDIPIIGSEFSLDDENGPAEVELRHANAYTRQNLILLGEGLRANLSFYNQDCGNKRSNRGYYYNLDPQRGFGSGKVAPKPQAMMYAAMSWLLEGHRSAGSIDWLDNTAMGYVYENVEDVTLALWDFGDIPRQIVLPLGVEKAQVYDCMGNLTVMPTEKGTLKLTISNSPIYVKNVSPKLWGSKALKPVKILNSEVNLFPGDSGQISLSVKAPADHSLRGSLVLSAGESLKLSTHSLPIDLAAGKEIKFEVGITASPGAAAGSYAVAMALMEDNVVCGGAGTVVKVSDPMLLDRVKPVVEKNDRKTLQFSLVELKKQSVAGVAKIKINGVPESDREIKFSMGAGEERTFSVSYDDLAVIPTRKYIAETKIELDSGYKFIRRDSVNFFAAKHFMVAPKIDGDAAKWDDFPAVELKGLESCIRNPQAYSGDTAKIRYGWDNKFLYLRVEVYDKVFVQNHIDGGIWDGDSLQCGFCVEPWKEFKAGTNSLADEANTPKQCEIQMALTKNGPLAWRGFSAPFNERRPHGALKASECRLVVIRQDDRLIYEAAFAWDTLALEKSPAAGDHIAVTIAVNDMDKTEQAISALCLFNGATERKDRKLMGILYLQK